MSRDSRQVESSFIVHVYFDQATCAPQSGSFSDSEPYFREVLRINPEHIGSLNNLGTALWRMGRLREAEECYQQALTIGSDNFAILNNLGNISWDQGRLDQALAWDRQAIAIQPDSPESAQEHGCDAFHLGKSVRGARFPPAALRLEPRSHDSYLGLGVTTARQAKRDERRLLRQGGRLRPDFPEARRNRAEIWLARGDLSVAGPSTNAAQMSQVQLPERDLPPLEWRRPLRPVDSACCRAGSGRYVALHSLCVPRQAARGRLRGGRVSRTIDPACDSLSRRRPRGEMEFATGGLRRSCAAFEPAGDPADDAGNHPR